MSNYSDSSFKDDPNSSWHKTFKLIPNESTVLDIGCSSGTFGESLIKQKNCVVDGIEIDEGDIAAAKKVLRKVYKFDIERDELKIPTRYDVVFMGDVVEHLARPIPALTKIKKLLKPNGVLVYSIPNITHLSVRLMLLSGEIKYGRTGLLDETHLHFYNKQEIIRVFHAAGFKIKKFEYTVNDMPYELVKKELKQLGLNASQDFKKIIQSTDGAAYQFVGVAIPAGSTNQKLPDSSPLNTVETYIKEMKGQYEAAVAGLQEDRVEILKTLSSVSAERDKLLREKDARSHMPKYIKQKARAVVRKIRK